MQQVKLSEATRTILKNFGSINKNLMFREGNTLSTISETKSIIAQATVAESFDTEFGIFDLPRFLAALSLYEDPELNIGDKFVTIVEGKRKLNYTFAEPSMLATVTPDTIGKIAKVVDSGDVEFKLPYAVFQDVNKALLTLKLPEFAITGNGEEITLEAVNSGDPTGDTYSVALAESDATFTAVFRQENMKLLPMDYDVKFSTKGLAKFYTPGISYYIVAEQKK